MSSTSSIGAAREQLKIAHLLRKYNPLEWGGTETAVRGLLGGLRTHGVEPVVFSPQIDSHAGGDPLTAMGVSVRRYRAHVPVWGVSAEQRRHLIAVGGNLLSFQLF